jgi:hypothetical protein
LKPGKLICWLLIAIDSSATSIDSLVAFEFDMLLNIYCSIFYVYQWGRSKFVIDMVHCWICFEDLKLLSSSNYAHMSLDILFPNSAVPTTKIPQ